ncbi:potassium channel family protein [Vibrio sp. 10N.222.49.B4]|uniref:potassium channel family protein n=1 Tax=Vibrio sp. 10N.222.49.B4 TaxID=3229613 RepID=UPI00354B5F4B
MAEVWYELAANQLEEDLIKEKNKNGMDFLQDFFLENRDDFFSETDFDDFDLLVSNSFTSFEIWLKEQDYSWLKILKSGKWYLKSESSNNKNENSYLDELPIISIEDRKLLEKPQYDLEIKFLKDYLELMSRLKATKLSHEKYLCAKKIALCSELDFNVPDNVKANYWKEAAEYSKVLSSVDSCTDFQKAAKYYQKDYCHLESAQCYELAYNCCTDKSNEVSTEMLRSSRIQFEMFGDHEEAMRVYVTEKDKERQLSSGWKRFALSAYKLTSEYGEKPWRVLASVVVVLLFATLANWILGISAGDISRTGELIIIHEFWNSLYYSIITFTTLGYGDYSSVGFFGKALSCVVSFSGLLLTSLFMVTVVRKYSRG